MRSLFAPCAVVPAAVFAAVVALLVHWNSASGAPFSREVGVTLIYEIDPTVKPENMKDLGPKLVAALDRRINTGWWKTAGVRQLDDGRIEVGIYGNDLEKARRIQAVAGRTGTLAFRILANNRDHQQIIEKAQRADAPTLKDENGRLLAWWVPLYESDKPNDTEKGRLEGLLGLPEIAKRTVMEGERQVRQVLVVSDDFNVNGSYLIAVKVDHDSAGKPCIYFRMNREGGERFAKLTGGNLPDATSGFVRKLGILFDGRLYSAPAVRGTIADRGEITGSFTQAEAEDLVTVLNSGSLPAKIRLVERRGVEEKPTTK